MAKEEQLQAAQKAAQDAIALNDAYISARKLAGQDTVDNLSHDFGTQASERVLSENTVNAFVDAVNKLLVFANNYPNVETQKKCAEQAVKFLQRASEIYQENAGEIDNRLISMRDELKEFKEGQNFDGVINRCRHYLGIAEKQFVNVQTEMIDLQSMQELQITPEAKYATPASTVVEGVRLEPGVIPPSEKSPLDIRIFDEFVSDRKPDKFKTPADKLEELNEKQGDGHEVVVKSEGAGANTKEAVLKSDALKEPPLKWYQRLWRAIKRFLGIGSKEKTTMAATKPIDVSLHHAGADLILKSDTDRNAAWKGLKVFPVNPRSANNYKRAKTIAQDLISKGLNCLKEPTEMINKGAIKLMGMENYVRGFIRATDTMIRKVDKESGLDQEILQGRAAALKSLKKGEYGEVPSKVVVMLEHQIAKDDKRLGHDVTTEAPRIREELDQAPDDSLSTGGEEDTGKTPNM